MKLDLKQVFNKLYKPSAKKITVVTVPEQRVISIEGTGDPNTALDFKQAVEVLFPVAYTLKFTYKKIMEKSFVVMPLEGLWWTPDMEDLYCSAGFYNQRSF